jgi:hypothetical protein
VQGDILAAWRRNLRSGTERCGDDDHPIGFHTDGDDSQTRIVPYPTEQFLKPTAGISENVAMGRAGATCVPAPDTPRRFAIA